MKKKSILLLPLILFGMVIAGCHGKKSDSSGKQDDTPVQPSGGEDTPSGEDVVHVSSVSVSPTSLNLEVGDTGNLTATVMPVNATNKTVTWSSSNSSFASVSNGVVTAVAKGQATITATADGKSGTCVVTVTDRVVPPDPGPGPQPPEPTESPFGVKIGAGEIQNIPVNEEFVPSGNQLGAYKLEGLNVKAGDTLAFYNETVAISENLGPNPDGDQNYNNYCGSLAEGFTVQADAASATLYLDYYGPENDEGHDWLGFFLTGGTSGEHGNGGSQTQVTGVVHYGQGASWEDAEMEPFNESGYDELRVVDLNLEEGLEFAIRIGNDDWRHFADGKNEAAIESGDIVDAGGNDHNFKVANAGKYSIYAKVEKGQDEKTVYIAKTGEYVPVEHTYGLIGEYSGYNWDHDEEMILNEGKTEASVENIPLHEGDLIKVRLDGKWTHAYGWESLSVKPEDAFKDGGEPDHNIEVVKDGIYDIKFIIATSKIEITGHPVPATPVSLDCEYKGGEVETGHALDAEKVFVYVKYSDDSKGTDNVAADAHYFIEDTEVEKTQVFTEPGSYEITVKYTLDEQELQGTMTVIVVAALVDLEGITPTPAETTLKVGETQQISLTFNPENASDKNVEYASDDEDVATVSETGLITAVAVGSATITINGAQGVSATVDVTVEAAPVPLEAHTLRNFTTETNIALTANGDKTEYSVINLALAKDDTFKIKMSEDESDWRGFDNIKTGTGSADANFSKANDSGDIKCDVAGAYNIYVTVDKNSGGTGKSIWIAEYHAPAALVEFTVTDVDAEWTSSFDYFVWAWGGDAGLGNHYVATLEGTSLKAELPENITGFLLLKVAKDTEWSDGIWDSENKKGQSRNITIEESVTSYPFTGNSVLVKAYLKGSNDITWWNGTGAYIVAEVVVGDETVFVEAKFVAAYDENKTLYFEIEVEGTTAPTSIKLYRCDPNVVTSLPTSAPTEGVWNYTNVGNFGSNDYVDLSIQ